MERRNVTITLDEETAKSYIDWFVPDINTLESRGISYRHGYGSLSEFIGGFEFVDIFFKFISKAGIH